LTEELITAEPSQLSKIIATIDTNIAFGRYPKIFKNTKKGLVLTKFGKRIKETFDYSTFAKKSTPKWNAYLLAESIGINVCAYCNRGYTFTILHKDKGIVRPEFDHFYSQEKHPYLGLSFYNLIPSCHICNSNLKHRIEFSLESHIHPYETSLDSIVRFSVRLKKAKPKALAHEKKSFGLSFFYGDLKSFDLVLRAAIKGIDRHGLRKALKNIRDFRIRELYQRHKDLVIDMILNTIIYDDAYIDSLLNSHPNLFRDRFDVLRHVSKNYPTLQDMPNRAFSKLTKDIHSEFGLNY